MFPSLTDWQLNIDQNRQKNKTKSKDERTKEGTRMRVIKHPASPETQKKCSTKLITADILRVLQDDRPHFLTFQHVRGDRSKALLVREPGGWLE